MFKLSTFCFLLSTLSVLLALDVQAASPDLSIVASSISFSAEKLYVGDEVRIYATVKNVGEVDVTGHVLFYQGSILIGQTQPVSLRAGGYADEVYVDFTVPSGSFNIRAVIQGTAPQDVNASNDVAITPLYSPLVDDDRDGVEDDDDNCISDANTDQRDTDGDSQGDVCDLDDDNDSLLDSEETSTDPLVADTDGDGVNDHDDAYSTDPTRSAVAVTPAPTPVAVSTPASSTATPMIISDVAATPVPTDLPIANESPIATQPTSAFGRLTISPLARFTYQQLDWRTYKFSLSQSPAQDGVRFAWDFGDGASSVQPEITHAFSGPGNYTVTLTTVDADGLTSTDTDSIEVSFFHLGNPFVQLTLGGLALAIILLCTTLAMLKRRQGYDEKTLS